ncbi:MAG: bifunctional hydroxymethylpyrimidine kinase/phosphomethylpyrimidine kinase [Christensenellales bacterium]|jgi:hydroxymethylpyrimidine/phosphomethylpyrimidine kinase
MVSVLSIAGTDPSGGAGASADLKTFAAHGVYGMSVVTALVAQNTCGVRAVQPVPPDFVTAQLDAVCQDIPPQAVKIGMLHSAPVIARVAEALARYELPQVVLDPVMVATSGDRLLDRAAQAALERLLPRCRVMTPNLPEGEALWGARVADREDMLRCAAALYARYGCAVLLKGGHGAGDCADLLFDGSARWFAAPRVDTQNTHGTGCTLSAALACNLARGQGLGEAVAHAKAYVTAALSTGLDLGRGHGPLNHAFAVGPLPWEG